MALREARVQAGFTPRTRQTPVALDSKALPAEVGVCHTCADRVEFGEADLAVLRDFLIRFREEQVLSGMVQPAEAPEPESASLYKCSQGEHVPMFSAEVSIP